MPFGHTSAREKGGAFPFSSFYTGSYIRFALLNPLLSHRKSLLRMTDRFCAKALPSRPVRKEIHTLSLPLIQSATARLL
jgi:hypothetical protein